MIPQLISVGHVLANVYLFVHPGVTRTKIRKMGLHCSDWAQVHFDNVKVPKRNIIGEPGSGFMYQMLQVFL